MIPRLATFLLLLLLTMTTSATPASSATGNASSLPPPPSWLQEIDTLYDVDLRTAGFEDRAFPPEQWWEVATPLLSGERGFAVEDIGRSVEGRPLRHATWGNGTTRVLLWSQMHGDESTGSMALADLFRFLGEHADHPLVRRLHANTTLHFFPMVNPDGAARFQRRNAQGIDINRDARRLASPEGQALKALFDRLQPDFGFNLHDQQAGYRVGDTPRQTAIALLAPPFDASNGINDTRLRAMEVAAVIRTALEPYLQGHIARWDETFNPRAFGDLTAQWGASTVLIEAGGIDGDPQKQHLRKLYFLALVAALDSIASGSHAGVDVALYRQLPENGDVWPDLRIDHATMVVPGQPRAQLDLMVRFRDPLSWTGGTISDAGDLADAPARRVIDAEGLYLLPLDDTLPAPGKPALFRLSRDPEGRDVVWTLERDLDTAQSFATPPATD
jgi:hypothetical protein